MNKNIRRSLVIETGVVVDPVTRTAQPVAGDATPALLAEQYSG